MVTVAMFAVFPPLPTEPVPPPKVRPSQAGANRRAAIMTLVTGSYSWRQKEFRIWRFSYDPEKALFVDEHAKSWGRGRNKFIHFVGDDDAKADANACHTVSQCC